MLWSALETGGVAGASLIVSVILARIIAPAAFGLIAMLQIFIAVGQMFAEAGIMQTLVRQPHRTPLQDSTALWLNMMFGATAYALLWIAAPWIAVFYSQPELTSIARLICLAIPLNAVCIVQTASLSSRMQFGRLAAISLSAVMAGGAVGIVMALAGYGVTALVWQQLVMYGVRALLLWILTPRSGCWRFGMKEAKALTGFSWKLMLSGFLDTVYVNIYAPIIGKFYTVTVTAMFWRADSLSRYAPQTLAGILSRVSLPAMSHIRDDSKRATEAFRRLLRCSSWLIFPLCAIAIAVARPMFAWVLTPGWLPAVIYFQLLCVAQVLFPLHSLNCTMLNVFGRSDKFLVLEVVKKCVSVTALCVSLPFGVLALCIGLVCSSFLNLLINIIFARRYIGLGIRAQLGILCPVTAGSAIAAVAAGIVAHAPMGESLQTLFGAAAGIAAYLLFTYMMRLDAPRDIIMLFKARKKENNQCM